MRKGRSRSGVANPMSFVTAQTGGIGVVFDTAGLSRTCGLDVRFLSVSVRYLCLDTTPDDSKLVAHTDAIGEFEVATPTAIRYICF